MLFGYKKRVNLGVGIGFLLQIFGRYMTLEKSGRTGIGIFNIEVEVLFGSIILLIGTALFLYGLCMYAKGKGYNASWGLLGFLTIIGWIILACLPDKHKSK